MKDSQIINLYWERNEGAIAATAEAYAGHCYTIAYQILQSREDAEECVNDTYWSAWNAIPPHRPEHLAAFLGKITRNHALNRYKMRRVQKRGKGQTELVLEELQHCIPAPVGVENVLEEKLLISTIEKFLYEQPQTHRRLFVGRYWYLYSIRELAYAYQMSQSKVASLLFRMRSKLKTYLENEGILL